MNEEQQFQKLARRVKWRRWLITIGLMIVVILGLGLAFVQMTRFRSQRASDRANREFEVVNTILSPNIQISDQYLAGNSFSGGTVLSHRYKEIAGARENWSPNREAYTWLLGAQGADGINATDTTDTAAYDRITQHKVPLFYNVNVAKPEVKRVQEVRQVAKQPDYLAEVALTFKQPLTIKQIQERLPKDVQPVWYWAGVSDKADATMMDNNFVGIRADGDGRPSAETYHWFKREAKSVSKDGGYSYNNFNVLGYAQKFVKKYAKINQAKFAGVIVTGKSSAFKPLTKAPWLAVSSVGYFEPQTEINEK